MPHWNGGTTRLVAVLLLLIGAAHATRTVQAAPLGSVRLERTGGVATIVLRTQGASVRARRDGSDAWVLLVTENGPQLRSGADATDPACDATLHAALALDDLDGNGRIEAARGEHARLLASAVWRTDGTWRSAVLSVDLTAAGTAELTWQHDSTALPSLGRLTAPPTPLRVARSGGVVIDTVVVSSGWPPLPQPVTAPAGGKLLQFDAGTGDVLPPLFESDVPLVSGVTAIDLDGDALTDRLYLADAGWRVWRLQRASGSGARTARFVATQLADLGGMAEAGAALQFAPDVALMAGAPRTLAVSVGSSNAPAQVGLRHWLFVLRDPLATPTFAPIRPQDLLRVGTTPDATLARGARGLVASLAGPLAAPVLTVAGHRLIVTRASGGEALCPLRVQDTETLQVSTLTPQLEWLSHTVTVERGSQLSLVARRTDGVETPVPLLECRLGDTSLPHCPKVRTVRRDYWVREDAQ